MKRKWYFIASVLVIGMIVLNGCGKGAKDGLNQEETSNESIALKSELENIEECYLCGESDASMMSYYRQYDSVGHIALNEWYVLDSRLVAESDSNSFVRGKSETFSYKVDAMPKRGMSYAIVSFKRNLNFTILTQNLCQVCLNKIIEVLQTQYESNEGYIPFCIVDYKTLKLYPVKNVNGGFFIGDFWITTENKEDILKMEAYYLPLRNEM